MVSDLKTPNLYGLPRSTLMRLYNHALTAAAKIQCTSTPEKKRTKRSQRVATLCVRRFDLHSHQLKVFHGGIQRILNGFPNCYVTLSERRSNAALDPKNACPLFLSDFRFDRLRQTTTPQGNQPKV